MGLAVSEGQGTIPAADGGQMGLAVSEGQGTIPAADGGRMGLAVSEGQETIPAADGGQMDLVGIVVIKSVDPHIPDRCRANSHC
jgi:hypothetical protein